MDTIETVKIVSSRHARGYVIINKSDYDKTTMELFGIEKKEEDIPKRVYQKRN